MLKRAIDIVVSLSVLLVLWPILLLLMLLVKVKLGSPVLFSQPRPDLNNKIFTMYKFRTMTDQTDASGLLLPDSARLTPFGLFLRHTSLDELPGLYNVLKGDMSLVGPRPLLVEYLPLYNNQQKRRHEVRPGITGWAQINGRNALSWEQKFDLDLWYVEHRDWLLDVKILFLTLQKVVRRADINQTGQVTMRKFTGSYQGRDSID
jgi:lipopolysaccharide/colanic/teichoic acid biosynthesis glycosyltransferase